MVPIDPTAPPIAEGTPPSPSQVDLAISSRDFGPSAGSADLEGIESRAELARVVSTLDLLLPPAPSSPWPSPIPSARPDRPSAADPRLPRPAPSLSPTGVPGRDVPNGHAHPNDILRDLASSSFRPGG